MTKNDFVLRNSSSLLLMICSSKLLAFFSKLMMWPIHISSHGVAFTTCTSFFGTVIIIMIVPLLCVTTRFTHTQSFPHHLLSQFYGAPFAHAPSCESNSFMSPPEWVIAIYALHRSPPSSLGTRWHEYFIMILSRAASLMVCLHLSCLLISCHIVLVHTCRLLASTHAYELLAVSWPHITLITNEPHHHLISHTYMYIKKLN